MATLGQLHSLIAGTFTPATPPSGLAGPEAATADEVERALASAWRIHETGSWRKLSAQQRCDILAEAHARIDDSVAQSMARADAAETGVPISLTSNISASLREAFASEALQPLCDAAGPRSLRTPHGRLQQQQRPHGPVVILAPWNVPSGTVVGKLVAALVAGCPVIVKPSEVAPSGLELFLRAVAGTSLPPGVLQWLHGGPDIGAALVADERVRVVQFTGSSEVGASVARACSGRLAPVLAECGGSNVAIVLPDADLDAAAAAAATGITMLNGQWCAGISRVLVHADIMDDFVQRVLGRFGGMKVGAAEDPATEFGPLSHGAHCDRMEAICRRLEEHGGCVQRAPGPSREELPAGHFFLPALVTGIADGHQTGEIFGPLATVQPFQAEAEAVKAANRQPQLQSYIFGKDADSAIALGSELDCGSVMINGVGFEFEGVTGEDGQPCNPAIAFFGATGLGQEAGGAALVNFFTGPQNVGMNG